MKETEKDFQTWVVGILQLFNWPYIHNRAGMNRRGQWSTPLSGHQGFPDFLAVKDTRVLLIELKSDKGKTSEHQEVWRNALTPAVAEGKVEYYLFRPGDRDKITEILKGEL